VNAEVQLKTAPVVKTLEEVREEGKKDPKERVLLDTGTLTALTQGGWDPTQHHPDYDRLVEELAGKQLLVPETAYMEFLVGLAAGAGPQEKIVGALVLAQVTVVEDSPSERFQNLISQDVSPPEQYNDLVIFGTGDNLGVTTFTGNPQDVRKIYGYPTRLDPTQSPERYFSGWLESLHIHGAARFSGN
jgi:hypothetical protein